jgi:hypothetical protein
VQETLFAAHCEAYLDCEVGKFILKMEAICSSETSAFTRATRRNNPEATILHAVKLFVRRMVFYHIVTCSR